MTCIIASAGAIAADRRQVGPHLCSVTKVWAAPDGSIFADAGDATWGAIFREWYCEGQRPDRRDQLSKLMHDMDGGIFALQIRTDGVIVLWSVPFIPLPMHTPVFGVGSGSAYALGAFSAGKTLVECIQIAHNWDEGTGPEVDVITLADAKPKAKRKRGR